MASAAASVESLSASLRAAFEPTHLVVEDESGGCGAKFRVVVVSPRFEGVALLARHRLVNDAVGGDAMRTIHALSIKAVTPAQWEKQKATEVQ